MEVNSHGLIIINVSCQGILHLKEIRLQFKKPELLGGVPIVADLGTKFMLMCYPI